jgi:hypothetical protein
MIEPKLQVRKLKSKDIFTCVKIIRPYIDFNQVVQLVANKPKSGNEIETREFNNAVGIEIVGMLSSALVDDEFRAWIADMGNMTLEEFDDSEIETPFTIISEIVKVNDLTSFFLRVSDILLKSFGNNSIKSSNGTDG